MMKSLTKPVKEGERPRSVDEALGFNQLSAMMAGQSNVTSPLERDALAGRVPELNIGSPQYNGNLDPALNPAFNI